MSRDTVSFRVIPIVLPKNLSTYILIDSNEVPLIYAARYLERELLYRAPRGKPISPNSIARILYNIKFLYEWAYEVYGLHLDEYLVQHDFANVQSLDSLADYMREHSKHRESSDMNPTTFVYRMSTIFDFLDFTIYRAHRGGMLNEHEQGVMARKRAIYREYLAKIKRRTVSARPSKAVAPYTPDEVAKIFDAIGPRRDASGEWVFKSFHETTALRNWTMFLMGLHMGLRRGEIINLKYADIERGEPEITIRPHDNDPDDTRTRQPRAKTGERTIPVGRQILNAIKAYKDRAPSQGGRNRSKRSPYLFLNQDGNPLSDASMNKIAKKIEKLSGVENFHWHRLRHTWAVAAYDEFSDRAGGLEEMKYLGGWKSHESLERYARHAIARSAIAKHIEYIELRHPDHPSMAAFSNA